MPATTAEAALLIASPDMTAAETKPRPLAEILPAEIFDQLRLGVLGQDHALRLVAVATFKHVTGKVPGNILMIGNSGTGKTTVMNNVQRLYHDVPEYRPFRAMTIINANLLVDSERLEFRPDRLLSAVEQRARGFLGRNVTAEELTEAIQRATVCIDEIDKMSTVVGGKPNPLGVVLQQGLLTLMEGERIGYPTTIHENGDRDDVVLDIDTARMMFICGGAFEGLYDQVYTRVTSPATAEKIRTEAIRTADGDIRLEEKFTLEQFFKQRDLFDYGMVPQFVSRFDNIVLLNDLDRESLQEILIHSVDSPFLRSKRYFDVLGIELELEEQAAALISEQAAKDNRTGARALRSVFGKIITPYEFDPEDKQLVGTLEGGKLRVTARMVRSAK